MSSLDEHFVKTYGYFVVCVMQMVTRHERLVPPL